VGGHLSTPCYALRIVVPKAPWSAVSVSRRTATAFGSASKAPASLPHSKALRAFSWFQGAYQRTGMSDCSENTPSPFHPFPSTLALGEREEGEELGGAGVTSGIFTVSGSPSAEGHDRLRKKGYVSIEASAHM